MIRKSRIYLDLLANEISCEKKGWSWDHCKEKYYLPLQNLPGNYFPESRRKNKVNRKYISNILTL